MYKTLTVFILISLDLFAATPQLYKTLGDPIYHEIPAVKKTVKISYFKRDKKVFEDFIHEARAVQKLGLIYDKKRHKNTLTKQEQKAYLQQLRDLDKQLKSIHILIKKALPLIIKKNYVNTFYQLKRTRIDILYSDPKSARAVKRYEKKLDYKKQLAKKQKIQRDKDAAVTHYNTLRSAKNLDGTWKGKSNDRSNITAVFKADTLTLHYLKAPIENILKGSYTIHKQIFDFNIQYRKRIKEDISHVRHINLKRSYTLKSITKQELILIYKDEIVHLKRL